MTALEIHPDELVIRPGVHRKFFPIAPSTKPTVSPDRFNVSLREDPLERNGPYREAPEARKYIAPVPVAPSVLMHELQAIDFGHREFPSLGKIFTACVRYYGVKECAIKSRRQQTSLVRVRHVFFYLARELTNRSFPEIGGYCGGRHHTTVMSGMRKIDRTLREFDFSCALAAQIQELTEIINGTWRAPEQGAEE